LINAEKVNLITADKLSVLLTDGKSTTKLNYVQENGQDSRTC